jgi:hypothetical protein
MINASPRAKLCPPWPEGGTREDFSACAKETKPSNDVCRKETAVTDANVSRNWREMRKAHVDFSVYHFHWIGFQIYFRRALGNLARADIETGAVPRTFDLGAVQRTLGKRPIPMRAEFLKSVELAIDFRDRDERPIHIGAQSFALLQSVGIGHREESEVALGSSAVDARYVFSGVRARRRCRPTLTPSS